MPLRHMIGDAFSYLKEYKELEAKNKKYKNITNIKYPLEYCTVIVDIYNSKEFICSDGHKEEWKMRCDNGTKVKNGQEAIVIYSPSTQEIFIERKEVMNKICGI